MKKLTFSALRSANVQRNKHFKTRKGKPSKCPTWTLSDWMIAVMGELGEAANELKKFNRGDYTRAEFARRFKKEIADAQIYLDLLAFNAGIDLAEVTRDKFNEVSRRIKSKVRL